MPELAHRHGSQEADVGIFNVAFTSMAQALVQILAPSPGPLIEAGVRDASESGVRAGER